MLLSKWQLSNFSYTYVWTENIRKIDLTCFYTRHVGMVVISVTTIWLSPVNEEIWKNKLIWKSKVKDGWSIRVAQDATKVMENYMYLGTKCKVMENYIYLGTKCIGYSSVTTLKQLINTAYILIQAYTADPKVQSANFEWVRFSPSIRRYESAEVATSAKSAAPIKVPTAADHPISPSSYATATTIRCVHVSPTLDLFGTFFVYM